MIKQLQYYRLWGAAGIGLAALLFFALWYMNPQAYFVASVPPDVSASGCDESLWRFNAEQEKLSQPCVYITGTVVRSQPEADGDYHIDIAPDAPFMALMNEHNLIEGNRTIGVEPICVVQPKKDETAFIKACSGFISSVYIPKVGQHIGVLGAFTQDKHLWMEIHPATKITVIP